MALTACAGTSAVVKQTNYGPVILPTWKLAGRAIKEYVQVQTRTVKDALYHLQAQIA